MNVVVSKFGGTSMGDANSMRKAAAICIEQNTFVAVVSATSGTTNSLIELGKSCQEGDWTLAEQLLDKIVKRHSEIAVDVGLEPTSESLRLLFEELKSLSRGIYLLRDCTAKALDALVSLGERMSSVLFEKELARQVACQLVQGSVGKKTDWLDVREVLTTDNQFGAARPILAKIALNASNKLPTTAAKNKIFVTQGFIGRSEDGSTTTLGRGGSDYSAALLAEAVGADILEIWTDVAGIATTDPRICHDAKSLNEISFKEASELATFGAKILHPATLAPAMRKQIPVFVGSTFAPKEGGTWIRKKVDSAPLLRAIAIRKKQVLVTLTTPDMLHAHGFLFNIFKVFNENKISIDAITTSEISVSLTLDDATLLNKKLISELEQFAEVQVEENLSLVSLIGNNINHTPGLAQKVFETISDINVRMICLGASKHNFCFLVDEKSGTSAVQRLHKGFSLGQ